MNSKYSAKKEAKGKEADRSNFPSSSGKRKDDRSQSSDSPEECDFPFPTLSLVDKHHLHCYSSILNRSKEEVITMEELNQLQPELEIMFSIASLRAQILRTELANLANAEENKFDMKPTSVLINKKKRKLSDARLSKSLKDLSKMRGRMIGRDISSENDTDNSADVVSDMPLESNKASLPKNDTPNKFWASVEPYVKDITSENIKDLDDMIMACDTNLAPLTIPPLGRHYSTTWAEEDLSQERVTSEKPDVMIKRAASLCERTTGPYVQRLVSALMDDPSNDSFSKVDSDSDSCPYLSKVPLYHTTGCYERRLKKELDSVGFVPDNTDNDDDEILAEIKKCNEELRSVAAKNKEQLELLKVKALRELKRQEVQTKVRHLETELNEVYRKSAAAKLKKKQLKKKEKEHAWKLIKEREELMKKLGLYGSEGASTSSS